MTHQREAGKAFGVEGGGSILLPRTDLSSTKAPRTCSFLLAGKGTSRQGCSRWARGV